MRFYAKIAQHMFSEYRKLELLTSLYLSFKQCHSVKKMV